MSLLDVYEECVRAVTAGDHIQKVGRNDKEFHFQNWFESRLQAIGLQPGTGYDQPGRNKYPDFRLHNPRIGFEIKGLAHPGRWKNYDANSQMPMPTHDGVRVYYVFGRYPKSPTTPTYPVLDLVIFDASFLNADTWFTHKNKSLKTFGSYGDVMVRDRKMYVPATPWALADGLESRVTLILPSSTPTNANYAAVGTLVRTEVAGRLVGYEFDLQRNTLTGQTQPNPNAGVQHSFTAWRLQSQLRPGDQVTMKP